MPTYLKELCDAVIDSLESPSEDFEDKIREVFCKMDEAYKATGLNDTKRAEKFSNECRHILVVLRLFPIELQFAMDNKYKKTLWGFLSIYLDFKMMLIDDQQDKEAYFQGVIKEIFVLLGDEEKTGIWSVVVTSHTLNRIEILRLLARQCIEATKSSLYDHEQYIRMIWVLHVFFSQCKRSGFNSDADEVLQTALKLKQPPGLCKWMCHHFPGFGWKGLTDISVHEALVSEKQPKSFFRQVYIAISKDDTLKYQLDYLSTNGTREEDSSSQCSENASNVAGKKVVNSSHQKEMDASSKETRTDSEKKSDLDKPPGNNSKKSVTETGKTQDKDKENQDSLETSPKDLNLDDSSKKTDSSSKPTKTLGPRRSKPISSSFLDDEETNDTNAGGDNTDIESDESKQADKENKKKSEVQSGEDITGIKKDKGASKKTKRALDSSDGDESDGTKGDFETKSKRSKQNKVKSKASRLPSDSETDVDETVEETKLKSKSRVSNSVKRKVNDDSDDSDHTIAESDITSETNNNGDICDEDSNTLPGRRSGRRIGNLRSQPAGKKPKPKKMKADSSLKPVTTIEKVNDEDDSQQKSKSDGLNKLAYADDEELQKIIDEYMKGPYCYIFSDFENQKQVEGAEPFINIAPLPPIDLDTDRESTLADVLHNKKQKAKEQKVGPSKKKKSRR